MNADWLEVEEPRVRPIRKVEFWEGFGGITSGAGLMVDWEWNFGSAMDLVRPFLRATSRLADSYPCVGYPPCDCRHRLMEEGGKWLSVCSQPGECFCERDCVELQPKDLVIHAVDRERLGEAVRAALGLCECRGAPYSSLAVAEVGAVVVPGGGLRAPTYYSMAESHVLAGELGRLKSLRDGPLVLLTPTASGCGCDMKLWLEREGGGHVPLDSVLAAEPGGVFRVVGEAQAIMKECAERLARCGVRSGPSRTGHESGVSPNAEVLKTAKVKAPPGPRYLLRKGLQGWRLVLDWKETVLWDEKAVRYVAVLLLDPPVEPVHGTELAHRAFGDAVVEDQRNLAMDDAETAREMAAARRRCQAVIEDDGASEVEREEARAELEEIQDWARKHLRGTEGSEQRQVRAIRQSIRRLVQRLRTARNEHGEADEVLQAFGRHLERYLLLPSSRGRDGRASWVRSALAGRFTYEPPAGVKWSG